MSDGSLTQDEIDALLQGSGGAEMEGDIPAAEEVSDSLSDAEKAAFQSVLQGTTASQSSNLGLLVNKTATLGAPQTAVMTKDGLAASLEDELVQVNANFSDGLLGAHSYLLPKALAESISGLMMGQADVELNEAALSALQEAMSQVSGPKWTSLGDTMKTTVLTDPAEARLSPKSDLSLPDGEFVVVTYPVTIDGAAPSKLTEIFTLDQVKEIAAKKSGGAPAAAPNMGMPQMPPQQQMQQPQMQQGYGMPPPGYNMPPPGYGMPYGMPQNPGMVLGSNAPNVQSVQFPGLNTGAVPMEHGNISLLMDVYMEMTVELGRTKKLIKEILGMGEGTIIELDKLAGEPVDILVNHKLIAKGEVVVIDENFGVRVTEIVSPIERMSDLT
jgi:flagellar motor switch protein FliN/FliY